MDGVRRQVTEALGPAPMVDRSALLEPPAGLDEKPAELWRELAPHAIAQGTLVPATVHGFRELVEQIVLKQDITTQIHKIGGAAAVGADELLRHYSRMSQRLDQSLARFRLTAAGKPEPSALKQPKAPSPWAAVGT